MGNGIPTRGVESWTVDMNISEVADASFIGEKADDKLGQHFTRLGDVNGDGYDDIGIGSKGNDDGGEGAGKTYLIFGKATGWNMDTTLSSCDASFIGESQGDNSGIMVSGAGDVNGDGYDDILIGAHTNEDGGEGAGKTYLIFGKANGWSHNFNLSNADASFIGEEADDNSGRMVAGAGDVNRDGYSDFLIGACWNDEGGDHAGQTYLILGKPSGWTRNVDLSNVDASFIGETPKELSAIFVSSAGDVNRDSYDDILIGAQWYGDSFGKSYLIFGKAAGWNMDTDLANADASFIGETRSCNSGSSVSGAGDVNGDGYDDILIGARYNDELGNDAGQTYLIFGKATGWSKNVDISKSDASFLGNNPAGASGYWTSGAGDVNSDGYDDLIIGARWNRENGYRAGKAYIIFGKPDGWNMDTSLANVDASFLGEYKDDQFGCPVTSAGDVNNDGSDDILIGAWRNDEGGHDSGQVYLIFGLGITEPIEVYSVKTFSDGSYSQEIDQAEMNDEIFIEMRGLDGNTSTVDKVRVDVSSLITSPIGFPVILKETGVNTGIYRKSIKIYRITDPRNRLLKVSIDDIVNISSKKNPLKYSLVKVVTPIAMKPFEDVTVTMEDEEYYIHYRNIGYNNVTEWLFETDSSWLIWNEETNDLYGTPNNCDVGTCWVRLNITDGLGHYDEHNFTLEVKNTLPKITTSDVNETLEDALYEVDYNCDDEGQGDTQWSISPSYIKWLEFDQITGIISGTPTGEDVGVYEINISVDDGNGGLNWTEFTLTVLDKNDPPIIATEPITEILQGKQYYVQFNAIDEDDINLFEWTLTTDAEFLELNNRTGVLTGTPENIDVGSFFVNISTEDLRGEKDWINFTLEVIDVNDPPTWSSIPLDSQVDQGEEYAFTVEAIDVDADDAISYSISSQPFSDISVDGSTGKITWIAGLEGLNPNPNYVLNVEISASDGEETIIHGFSIMVIPNPAPISTLIGPIDGQRITSEGILLEWEGEDDGDEPLKFDIYLGISETDVSMQSHSLLWMEDVEGTSIHTGDVEQGKTYYWTVIPKDIFSSGICTNDVFSFIVNIPPYIQEFAIPKANIGVEFRLNLMGSDLNGDDIEFALEDGPVGMDIFNGMITWIPSESQVGTHTVNVSLSDGYDTIYREFEVEVTEKDIIPVSDDKGFPILLIIIVVVILILIGAGIGVFLYMKNKKEPEPTEEIKEESPPEDTGLTEKGKQFFEQFFGQN